VGSIIFCARQQTRLAERAGQKIILQRQLSDLRMQGLHVDHRFWFSLRGVPKNTSRTLKQLITPLLDLVRMNVEILCQLDQRLLALDRGHGHFCLECRTMIPARSSCHSLLLACSIMLLLRGKSTYPSCSDLRSHLCHRLLKPT
jgi:hypothetical protein